MTPDTFLQALSRTRSAVLLTLLTLAGALIPAAPLHAQAPAPLPAAEALQSLDSAGGVRIVWRSPGDATVAGAGAHLPTVRYQGYDLPMQAIPVRLAAPDQLAALRIESLDAVKLPPDAVTPGPPVLPPVLDLDGTLELAPPPDPALPPAPIFVLRSGRVNGEYVAVLGVSPIFADSGGARLALSFDAFLPGATQAAGGTGAQAGDAASVAAVAASLSGAARALEAAGTARFKIKVTAPGIQRVPLSALPGFTAADLSAARLTYRGEKVAVQVAGSELRFFTPTVGDRWNTASTYLLSVDPADRSPAMGTRAVAPLAAAGAPSVALERNEWITYKVYRSLRAGPDGDHWFAADLSSEPGAFSVRASNTVTATLTDGAPLALPSTLPPASGTSAFTVRLSPYRGANNDVQPLFNFRAQVDGGAALALPPVDISYKDANGRTRWQAGYDLHFTAVGAARTLVFSLLPAADFAGANVNSIAFERPVTLDFAQRGGSFAGSAGQTRYAWANAGPAGGLYDVTDPARPIVLTGANGNGFTDPQAARSYWLAGERTLHAPAVEALAAASFGGKRAHAIYIVPAADYAARLEPLRALRAQQGYQVEIVQVQHIYDAFSFGMVAPEGIRRFLQFAYANWANPRPLSVVLVGDGTWDVKNYEDKAVAPALIPPYMRDDVDPWLGEAPCDNCYGQLDGSDPHTGDDSAGRTFDTELWVGRFPVKSPDELDVLVKKIVGYETATDLGALWRSKVLYYADNYLKPGPSGPNCTPAQDYRPDPAGDFARLSDNIFTLHPTPQSAALAQRVYYDPFPQHQTPPAVGQPWREPNTNRLGERVLGAMNAGVAVSVYNGHANTWIMGATERDAACTEPGTDRKYRPAALMLYDEIALTNDRALFVQLSMTCLTAQFAAPADSGTTIDERLVLHPHGGAVAAWGPAGLSVVHGHDQLQRGFFTALFAAPEGAARLGELLDAGYSRVLSGGYGTEDVLRTFHLLGDPLTSLRFAEAQTAFLPIVGK